MEIRKAVPADTEHVYSIIKSQKSDSFSIQDLKNSTTHEDAIFFVAEGKDIKGYVIGFVCPTKKSDAMLAETRVKESERSKGIGKQLVDKFCKEAFSRGVESVFAEVREEDVKFYEKADFKESNRWIGLERKA